MPLTDVASWFCCTAISVVTMQVLTDWAMGLGRERLQDLPATPKAAHRIPLPACASAVPAAAAELLYGLQHSMHRKLSISSVNYDDLSYSMKRLNFLYCKDGGGVRLLQERDKTTNFQSKHLGCRCLIHMGTFELFNLHTHISSQYREWISIELKNSLCKRRIRLIFVHLPA